MPADDALFAAFREDHAVLGRGFHDLSQSLRSRDLAAAQAAARRLNEAAGAHIAFEERHFYPALVPLLGADEVKRLLEEHALGLAVVREILAVPAGGALADPRWRALLENSQEMEQHIAECGELFEAMGRLAASERAELYRRLLALRRSAPRWTELAAERSPDSPC